MNRLIILLSFLFLSTCKTFFNGSQEVEKINITSELGIEIQAIKESYVAPDCYFAKYSIKGINSDGSSKSANGIIRADNQKSRMMMEFSVPFIGYKISRMIIKDKRVYINDLYNNKKFDVALESFALGGLTQSKIPLPFYIFQDILYARLPSRIYEDRANRILDGKNLTVSWKTKYENHEYIFESRRLKRVTYKFEMDNAIQNVEMFLSGRYKKTSFPNKIRVISHNLNSRSDQLILDFNYITKQSRCLDSYFQVN